MADSLADLFATQLGPMDIEIWMEPFAGGAGAGLTLLADGNVPELWLVEKNPALAALWRAVLNRGDELAARIEATIPDLAIWESARETLLAAEAGQTLDDLELGYAAMIVNRCSRSGIVSPRVGPIGGKHQAGKWTVGARFNAAGIAARICDIAALSGRIRFAEGDAVDRIAGLNDSGIGDELLLFVDPPYIREGSRLYRHAMTVEDHQALADALNQCHTPWLLTYDDEPMVADTLYPDRRILAYEIPHSANRQRIDWEYAVLSDNLTITDNPDLLGRGQTYWLPDRREPNQLAS